MCVLSLSFDSHLLIGYDYNEAERIDTELILMVLRAAFNHSVCCDDFAVKLGESGIAKSSIYIFPSKGQRYEKR